MSTTRLAGFSIIGSMWDKFDAHTRLVLLSAALLGTLARFEMSYGCLLRMPKVRSGVRFLAHICRGAVTTEVADPNAFAFAFAFCACVYVCVCVCLHHATKHMYHFLCRGINWTIRQSVEI